MKMNKILSLVVTAALAVSTLGTALPVFAGSVSGNNGNYTEYASGSSVAKVDSVAVTGRTEEEFKAAGLPAKFTVQKASVEAAVETKLEEKATAVNKDAKVVASVDIKINNGAITDLKKPIPVTISVAIPKADLEAADVVVIREHNGAIDVLPCYVVGSTVAFESDKFSSFAVALLPKGSYYKTGNGGSNAANPAEPPIDSVPKTGEQLPIVLLGLTVLSAIGCALTFKKREQN